MILPGMEIRLTSLLLSEFCCSFFADEHMISLFLQLSPYLLVIMQKLFQLIFISPLLGFGLSFFILKYLRNAFILLLLVHVSTSQKHAGPYFHSLFHKDFGFVHEEVSCSVKWAFQFKVLTCLENEIVFSWAVQQLRFSNFLSPLSNTSSRDPNLTNSQISKSESSPQA